MIIVDRYTCTCSFANHWFVDIAGVNVSVEWGTRRVSDSVVCDRLLIALNVNERTTATDSGNTSTQGIVFVLDVRRTVVPNVDTLELVVKVVD